MTWEDALFQRIQRNQEAGTQLLQRFNQATSAIKAPPSTSGGSAVIRSSELTKSYNEDYTQADPLEMSVAVLEMEVQKTRELIECKRTIVELENDNRDYRLENAALTAQQGVMQHNFDLLEVLVERQN